MKRANELIPGAIQKGAEATRKLGPCGVCGREPEVKPIAVGDKTMLLPCVCECRIEAFEHQSRMQERDVRKQALLAKYAKALPPRLHEHTSLTRLDGALQGPREGMRIARLFLSTLEERLANGDGCFFHGTPGTGKSTVSKHLAGDVDLLGYFVIWAKAKALADRMWDADTRIELVKALEAADLVVIDEVAFEGENRFTAATLFTLVDTRYEAGRSTVVTANFDLKGLAEHYQGVLQEAEGEAKAQMMVQRFVSRFQPPRFQPVPFAGPDLRLARRRDWTVLEGGA